MSKRVVDWGLRKEMKKVWKGRKNKTKNIMSKLAKVLNVDLQIKFEKSSNLEKIKKMSDRFNWEYQKQNDEMAMWKDQKQCNSPFNAEFFSSRFYSTSNPGGIFEFEHSSSGCSIFPSKFGFNF
jgi:hypothetical protein